MNRLIRCSMSRLACLLLLVLAVVADPGCSSGSRNPGSVAPKPSLIKGDKGGLKEPSVALEPQTPERPATGQTEIEKGLVRRSPSEFVRLGTIPTLKFARRARATAQETEEIKRLIRNLAAIDTPDFGLSGTMSGDAFLPIDGMSQAGPMALTNHQLESWSRGQTDLLGIP